MTKSTDELMNELIRSNNIGSYLKENSEYMVSEELPVYLINILKVKELVKSSVIKKSELSEVMGYQIFSGTRRPSRDSLISICAAILSTYNTGVLYFKCSRKHPKNLI